MSALPPKADIRGRDRNVRFLLEGDIGPQERSGSLKVAGFRLMAAPRIGLALGSGSARGWSHIGIIESLVEAGTYPAAD